MRTFFISILCLINLCFFSQNKSELIISNQIPEIGIRLEQKFFYLESNRFRIQEIKPYFILSENIKIGIGYCWLKNNNNYFEDSTLLSFSSSNFFVSKHWTLSKIFFAETTLDFGVGKIKSIQINNESYKGIYSFLEPALILNYEGFNFFSLGLGSGIRITRSDRSVLSNSLTLPTVILRFSFKLSEIYNHFFIASNSSLYLHYDRRV
jgi:hypothetical protein